MPDCRLILDNLNDYVSFQGPLVTGSDVIDISGAQMIFGADGWRILIKTVSPAQQNPRFSVSVALYLDIDGRMDNNATAGPRLGSDTVYGIAYRDGQWKISKEVFYPQQNAFLLEPTNATYSINNDGYTLNVPYSEISKTASAYWKVGVAEKDATHLTVDYAPDSGMACTPSLSSKNGLADLATHAKYLWNMGLGDQVFAGMVVIAALLVIFFKWKKAKSR